MNHMEFQVRGVSDPRLAPYATSALPAWLWSIDGTRILWANPVGASDAARSLLGFRNLSEVGLDGARSDALKLGRLDTPVGSGHLILQRVGTGADIGLVALIVPG